MTRLYIVEQSGIEAGGHYQAYTGCVVDGARQLGLEPVVLANKRLRPPPYPPPRAGEGREGGGALPPEVIPCFTYTWGEAEQHGKLGWEEGNIAYEMFEAFRRVPPDPEDHVFLHTTGYRELRALLDCLTGRLPGEPLPYFHLLLRRDPDLLIENYRDYAEYFARIAASAYLRRKILLHTDTDLLSQAFAAVCRAPFATAPIPFEQSLLRAALAARGTRREGDKLTIVYLGDAREEKGYQHLPQALSYLWRDYVEPGRVRFVLQSNFNTPGGEPGILSASQNLAGFLHTILKSEPLQPAEYYEMLAGADIVLIPYSAQRYRYRSSGVLVEAMGAGKPVVTSAGSWMATQVGPEHAVLFDTPAGLGPAIAAAVDRFDELSAGAAARSEATLARATGASLVQHLLTAAAPPAARARSAGRRVLFVMNGDAMVLENGASRVAQAQLRYLTAAGFDVAGLFLSLGGPQEPEDFAKWRAALVRSIAPFPLERVFVAGPGGRALDPDQSPSIRHQRQHNGAALKAEFDFVAGFEFGGNLLRFLRTHRVDAVLLNYITNYPVVEALGLDGVPVICEMHDLQSFQRAIYGQRLVDAADLDEEFGWLARCAALVSLNPRETAIVRERLPGAVIETTGVFLPTPPSPLQSLAGAKDLAEIVSSAGPLLPEYQFEAAWQIGRVEAVERLIAAGSVDMLYVSSAHMANVSGLKWFLSEVYEPYLAHRQASMIVAGSIGRIAGWPQHPRLFFIDQVDDLAPLYAAARVVVLPITEGAGSPVKTYEALAYGRPIVGTSHAFRGVDGRPGEFAQCDEPAAFAEALLDLLNSERAREQAAQRARQTANRLNDFGRYFQTMDRVFAQVLPGASEPTPPPEAREHAQPYIEWPSALQPVNRLVRSYVDGEPLEGWALELLAQENDDAVDRLLDEVSRSLFEQRDAAVLRTEQRLKRYLVNPLGSRLREDAVHAVRLALAGRRAAPPDAAEQDTAHRVIAFGGLPLTVAGLADAADANGLPLRIEGRALSARRLADPRRLLGGGHPLQAEIAALDGGQVGLRTIELEHAAPDGKPRAAVLRHSIRISPGLRLLERDVFGGGFEVRSDGTGADLAPGMSGRLSVPRITDGRHVGYVDLCFAQADDAAEPASAQRAAPAITVMLDDGPAEIEPITGGGPTLVRVFLGENSEFGDFGVAALTVANRAQRSPLRLAAVHSGLLLGPTEEAAAIATVLTLATQRSEPVRYPRVANLARAAVATIVNGELPDASGLDALSVLSQAGSGQDALRALVSQELARGSRRNGGARDASGGAESVIDDILAIIGSPLGLGDAAAAIMSPVLPFEIVDDAGRMLDLETAAALRQRAGSWRVAMPAEAAGRTVKISLDATFEVPGHPGLIEASGFHPLESPTARHRWTGPEPTSTIAVPVMLHRPARLVIELGPTGQNAVPSDFTIACNGKPVPHVLESGENSATLTADLPAVRSAPPRTELSLTVRHCFQQPPDRRVLGVVFRSLALLLGGRAEPQGSGRGLPATQRVGAVPAAGEPAGAGEPPPPDGEPAPRPGAAGSVIDEPVPQGDKNSGKNSDKDDGPNGGPLPAGRRRAGARDRRRGRDPDRPGMD